MLLIVFLVVLGYFIMGMPIARHEYALRRRGVAEKIQSAESVHKAFATMKHGPSCYQNPNSSWYNQRTNCDCDLRSEWRAAKRDLPRMPVVRSPYALLVGWPGIYVHKYLTSGSVKKYDPNLTRQLEALNGIEPFRELE